VKTSHSSERAAKIQAEAEERRQRRRIARLRQLKAG
jgi:hypothetical protein